jgi:hypothetical protein
MAQLAFRQQIASDMFDGLVDAGMADPGTYTPPGVGQTPVDCRGIVINRGQAPFGTFGTVSGNKTTVRLLCTEVPTPLRGAVVVADGGTFVLVEELANDGALSTWSVK